MNLFLAAGAGFLIAVLWMDLMFDVLALRRGGEELPEEALAQIACYYRRVTTTASPMNNLIGLVMTGMVGTLVLQIVRRGAPESGPLWLAVASLGLCGVPIALALLRIFPDAVRLGSRKDSPAEQSRLARGICLAHLACLAAMVAFLVLRFSAPA